MRGGAWFTAAAIAAGSLILPPNPAGSQGRGQAQPSEKIQLTGECKQWHTITLTLDGPHADERDSDPNPFTDYRFVVTFRHESGSPTHKVPGYFAADGNAANTSATRGNKWRAHLTPGKIGRWNYRVSFVKGKHVAVDSSAKVEALPAIDGKTGVFDVAASDKQAPDFRSAGRLEYVGKRYLRFAGSGEYFLKVGADSPETLLAYRDFDGTETKKVALKTWQPHVGDWKPGDPTWKNDKGKGLIGALNYLSSQGVNGISFLTYNAGGDGDNVWPFVSRNDKLHYDCSKLDQWLIVFEHAQAKGLFLHFKMQENESDDDRVGSKRESRLVPESLDGGRLGPERKLYCRELVARFGHLLALNWNLGEENTQSPEEQRAMASYLVETDPYPHPVVVHTFPGQQDEVYSRLLGMQSVLHGASLQNGWQAAHQRTLKWVVESEKAGRPWIVCNDEQNPASLGVPPDEGFAGQDGIAKEKNAQSGAKGYTRHDIRKWTLWGTLTAGGAGVEYYFGYELSQNDLNCEDFRSREKTWQSGKHALAFFSDHKIPYWEMVNADELVGNPRHDNGRFCLAKRGEAYVVYLPVGGTAYLNLTDARGAFRIRWYDPRGGGELRDGSVKRLEGGKAVDLGQPPSQETEDWVALIQRE